METQNKIENASLVELNCTFSAFLWTGPDGWDESFFVSAESSIRHRNICSLQGTGLLPRIIPQPFYYPRCFSLPTQYTLIGSGETGLRTNDRIWYINCAPEGCRLSTSCETLCTLIAHRSSYFKFQTNRSSPNRNLISMSGWSMTPAVNDR